MDQFDFIIVGGGSAGCVLASRLSENPDTSVCLVEAGTTGDHWSINVPAGLVKTMQDKQTNWLLQTEPQPNLGGRRMFWPRGKALGGSSAINGMVYIRGHRADYDRWASEEGCPGWDWESVLPLFRRSENNERIQDDLHGQGGPLNVMDPRSPSPLSHMFVEAAASAQIGETDDFNGPKQEGAGLYQLTQKDGQRHSVWHAYLQGVQRPNLRIITGARATRIRVENGRAVGIDFRREGQTADESIGATREVLLSGGAVHSPHLLLLSGIGPGQVLAEHGIAQVREAPEVGRNLQDHLDISLVQHTSTNIGFAFTWRGLSRLPGAIREYRKQRTGLLTSNFAEAGIFTRSQADEPLPDLQYHFLPVMSDNHGKTRIYSHGVTLHCCDLRPKSRGHIGLASSDPMADPLIDPNYLDHPDDLQKMIRGVEIGRQVFAAPPTAQHMANELHPGADVQGPEALEAFVRRKAETIYHPVGSCRMGKDEAAVVDPELRVRGVEGLRVVDASVMPSLIGGNTNAPTVMIAERAADLIRAT
ncbi:MAG: choline dehydrogenase [Minwuia thermotolerans]|nr:MAG: choline dehydrogenase [Minwuia thermotolerans]